MLTGVNVAEYSHGMTQTMLQSKGPEYVQNWCRNIGNSQGRSLSQNEVALIAGKVLGEELVKPGSVALDPTAIERVIGALTSETAKPVVTAVEAAWRARNPHGRPSCHFCGLPVGSDGDCRECV
jgi:hypothetical protein